MGYPGIEISWSPGSDNNWVSYYVIYRNHTPIDKVAKGQFYFDHSAGADLGAAYEIETVDGAGNVSRKAVAKGPSAAPAQIVDDANAIAALKQVIHHVAADETGAPRHQCDWLRAHAALMAFMVRTLK